MTAEGVFERSDWSDTDWWIPEPVVEEEAGPADGYAEGRGRQRAEWIQAALNRMQTDVDLLSRHSMHGTRFLVENGMTEWVALAAARIQTLRRHLADIESLYARAVGRDDTAPRDGVLPDGRPYEVLRGAERKAFDHDAWKADVRRQLLSGVGGIVVDADTGEAVDIEALLRGAQDVHGSTSPKTTALKALGLRIDDYCERSAGPWAIRVSPLSE